MIGSEAMHPSCPPRHCEANCREFDRAVDPRVSSRRGDRGIVGEERSETVHWRNISRAVWGPGVGTLYPHPPRTEFAFGWGDARLSNYLDSTRDLVECGVQENPCRLQRPEVRADAPSLHRGDYPVRGLDVRSSTARATRYASIQ